MSILGEWKNFRFALISERLLRWLQVQVDHVDISDKINYCQRNASRSNQINHGCALLGSEFDLFQLTTG